MTRSVSPSAVTTTSTTAVRLWRTELENENGHSKPLKDNGAYIAECLSSLLSLVTDVLFESLVVVVVLLLSRVLVE
jgi:hypothetical protein